MARPPLLAAWLLTGFLVVPHAAADSRPTLYEVVVIPLVTTQLADIWWEDRRAVIITFRAPIEAMQSVSWEVHETNEALHFIRLLQQGVITAVRVQRYVPSMSDPEKLDLCSQRCVIRGLAFNH